MYRDLKFCCDPIKTNLSLSLSNKGRTFTHATTTGYKGGQTTYSLMSGKVYFEYKPQANAPGTYTTGGTFIGFSKSTFTYSTQYPGQTSDSYGVLFSAASTALVNKYTSSVNGGQVSTYAINDIFGFAIDVATGKWWLSRNGVWQNSGDPVAGTTPIHTMGAGPWFVDFCSYNLNESGTFNFEAQDFVYAPPDGFYAAGEASLSDYVKQAATCSWPLNETSGTTATDVVSANNASYEGGAVINQSGVYFESSTKYVSFDGVSQRIVFPSTILSAVRMAADWSIECFVKIISSATDGCIWYLGSTLSNKSDEIALVAGPTGDRYLKVLFRDSSNNALSTITATAASLNGSWGKWLYVVVTKTSTNTFALYVNGTQIASTSITGYTTVARTVFRAACDEGSNYTNICLSNFAFHTTALTQNYITRRFLSAHLCYTHFTVQTIADSSPLAYWKLSEQFGTYIGDYTKNGYFGTLYGTVTFNENSGILAPYDKSLRFNGTDGCVEIAHATWNSITSNLTLEAWVCHDSATVVADEGIISKYVNDTGYTNKRGYELVWQSDGKIAFNLSSDGTTVKALITTNALSVNTWYHVAAVYTPSSRMEIFINGVSAGFTTTSVPSAIYSTTAPVFIGNHYYVRATGNTNAVFSGWISDVAIYNKSMVVADLLTHYTRGRYDHNVINSTLAAFDPADLVTTSLSNNNLTMVPTSGSGYCGARTTIYRRTGKYYFEMIPDPRAVMTTLCSLLGLSTVGQSLANVIPGGGTGLGFSFGDNSATLATLVYYHRSATAVSVNLTVPSIPVFQIAIDFDEDKLWVGVNNSWVGDPASGSGALLTGNWYGGRWCPVMMQTGTTYTVTLGLSSSVCAYSPPSGFLNWDQSGLTTGFESPIVRTTRSQLQVLTPSPNDGQIRTTRSQLQTLISSPNPKIGTAYCSRIQVQYMFGHQAAVYLYATHLQIICKKPSNSGLYKLSGTVTLSAHSVKRKVRAHASSDGTVLGTAVSNPNTGYFEIITTYNLECYVIAFDDVDSPDLQSIIYDRVFPVAVA